MQARRTKHRRLWRALTLAGTTAMALLAAEAAIRLYLWRVPARLRLDERCGWKCVERYSRIGYSTDDEGFRTSPRVPSGRARILVLGDSFTQAVAVADDETYHALLAERLKADVWAYGAGGYGTLQELQVLDEVVDRIRPDLVVWQFCTNDFINNDAALERASRWDNNAMRRPYWEDGVVRYELPKPFAWLRQVDSKVVWATFLCWDRLGARWGATVEDEIRREGLAHAGLARSMRTTEGLLARARARAWPTPLVVFPGDEREPYSAALREITGRLEIPLVESVPRAIRAARERGVSTLACDHAHWNAAGHRICAEELARFLAGRVRPAWLPLLRGAPRE